VVNKRFSNATIVTLAVGGIFALALAVRVFGIGFGLPYADQPDEPSVADKALKILQSGDLNPHYFVYPHLYYYMQAALYGGRILLLKLTGQPINLATVSPTDFYLWGRLLTALLGAGTSLLVFAAGRRLYGAVVGLAAALFIAFNSISITNSQFITTDVPAMFFTTLAFLLIVRLLPPQQAAEQEMAAGRDKSHPYETQSPQTSNLKPQTYYAVVGVAMGLAVGTKYNAAIIGLPFLLAHGYAAGWQLRRFFGLRLWLALGAAALAFALTSPFVLLDLSNALKDIQSVITHYKYSGHPGFQSDQPWLAYLTTMWRDDTLVTLLAGIGLLIAVLHHRAADVVLLSFPLAYYIAMSQYIVIFPRNLLPMLPFVAILAALPLDWVWGELGRRAWRVPQRALASALVVVALISVALPAYAAFQNDTKNSIPDTRAEASAWLNSNAPPGAKLWLEPFSLLLPADRYVIQGGDGVIGHDIGWYAQQRFDYLVVSEGYYGKFLADPQQYKDEAVGYSNWFKTAAPYLAAEFPRSEERPGPGLRIYRSGYQRPTANTVKPQHPLTVNLTEAGGGAITLLGYDVGRGQAGGSLPLTLYWRCDAPLKADYTVFVHLIDAKGATVAQRDTLPRSGAYPTSRWQSGELVVDEQDVPLPASIPPADYRIEVGMYLPIGTRLNTADGSGSVTLGEATVKLRVLKAGCGFPSPREGLGWARIARHGPTPSPSRREGRNVYEVLTVQLRSEIGIAYISPLAVPT
jgi:4-amino-4-deoxy-L-arabinose transferase-like glycosyltransferase